MIRILYFSLFVFMGLILTNCVKDQNDMATAVPENDQEGQILYEVQIDRQKAEVKKLSLESVPKQSEPLGFRGQSASANGQWTSGSGSTLGFSAVQNNGGIHGQSQFHGNALLSTHFDTDCIVVVDNRAYFGGEITQWEVIEGGLPGQLGACDVGWSIYFAVEDNGEGANAEDDAIGQSFFVAPPEDPPACQDVYAVYEVLDIPFHPGVNPTNIDVK